MRMCRNHAICTRLAASSPDSGELVMSVCTGSSGPPSASVSGMSSVRAPRRLRMDLSCCSWRSALCSGDSQPSPACSLLERRSLGPTEPTEPPSSNGELDGFRHLCTHWSNGDGVSASAIRHTAPVCSQDSYNEASGINTGRKFQRSINRQTIDRQTGLTVKCTATCAGPDGQRL